VSILGFAALIGQGKTMSSRPDSFATALRWLAALALCAGASAASAQATITLVNNPSGQANQQFDVIVETRINGQPSNAGTLTWGFASAYNNISYTSSPTQPGANGVTTATLLATRGGFYGLTISWNPGGQTPVGLAPSVIVQSIYSVTPVSGPPALLPTTVAPSDIGFAVALTEDGQLPPDACVEWKIVSPQQGEASLSCEPSFAGQASLSFDLALQAGKFDFAPGPWLVSAIFPSQISRAGEPVLSGTPGFASHTFSFRLADPVLEFVAPPVEIALNTATDFTVQLSDGAGFGFEGFAINWSGASNTAIFFPESGTTGLTDAQGRATFSLAASSEGEITLTATPPGAPDFPVFHVLQAVSYGLSFDPNPNPGPYFSEEQAPALQVATTRNNGNTNDPEDGVPVQFSIASGNAVFQDTGTATTSMVSTGGSSSSGAILIGRTGSPVVIDITAPDRSPLQAVLNVNPSLYTVVAGIANLSISDVETATLEAIVERTGSGAPVRLADVPVSWSVTPATASVAPAISTTATDGLATTVFTPVTNQSGLYMVTALFDPMIAGVDAATADIDVNVTALVRSLTKPATGSGDGQSGPVSSVLQQPLRALALNSGTPASGVIINWTVGSGATLSTTQTTTNGDGISEEVVVTLGSVAQSVTIVASRQDEPAATTSFVVTAVPLAQPSLRAVGGNGQAGLPNQPGQPLRAEYTIAGVPQNDETVTWTVLSGVATLSAAASTTDGAGVAEIGIVFGPSPGPVVVRARTDEAFADFTMSIAGALLQIDSGNEQQAAAGSTLAEDLVARVTVAGGSSPAGFPVLWEVVSGGGSISEASTTSDGLGRAGTRLTLGPQPGINVVRARIEGGNTVEFTATGTGVGSGPTLVGVSGDGQSGTIQTRGAEPLVVELRDASGQPMEGRTIQWLSINGTATLEQASSLTDAAGRAQVTFRYGAAPGISTLRARSDATDAEVDFQVQATGASLVPVSGDGQSGSPGQQLAQELVVAVVPTMSKSLAGITVNWQVTQGDGSISQTQTTTEANGQARNNLRLGPALGVNRVVASIAGGSSVTFQAEAVAGSGQIRVVSGNNQAVATNQRSAPLVLEVVDGTGAPLAGVRVDWTAVLLGNEQGSNATLENAFTQTDSQGRTSNTARVMLSGTARVRAQSPAVPGTTVEFMLNGGLINIASLTPEQRRTGEALDNACPALAALASRTPAQEDLFQRCIEMTDSAGNNPADTRNALDQLPSRFADALVDAGFSTLSTQQRNHATRFETLRKGKPGDSSQLSVGLWTPTGVMPLSLLPAAFGAEGGNGDDQAGGFSRWGFFATGTIGRGTSRTDDRSNPGFSFDTNGLTAGVDYRFTDQMVGGVSVGYARNDSELRRDLGALDARGWAVSAYATWFNAHNWFVDGVLSYGVNDYRMQRAINYSIANRAGGRTQIDQVASGDTDGTLLGGSVSVGRDFNSGAWNFSTYLRGNFARVELDAFEERMLTDRQGTGLALRFDSRTLDSLSTSVGAKASYVLSRDWGVLMPHAQVEWEHQYRDDTNRLVTRFVHDPTGTPMEQFASAMDTDYFNVGVGVSALFPGGRTVFVYYERLMGNTRVSQGTLSLGGRFEF
jgi:uncharacterized protein YhjY with autotransporter beta-barrel domain